MKSNKTIYLAFVLILAIAFSGCKKNNEPPPYKLFENQQLVAKTAKDLVGENISFVTAGYFESDSLKSIVAGVEISQKDVYGIKFYLISWINGEFQIKFTTDVINGSFVQCLVDKIKFSGFDTELVYYNSKNYFLGNASGDVYAHVIDFKKLKVYSAHLSVITEGRVTLELSDNIDNQLLKTFFISYFRRDYPNLRLIEKLI